MIKQDPIAWLKSELGDLRALLERGRVDVAGGAVVDDDAAALREAIPVVTAAVERPWDTVRVQAVFPPAGRECGSPGQTSGEHVHAEIEARLGALVVEAVSHSAGFSPGLALRPRTADGADVFVKAVSGVATPHSVDTTAAKRASWRRSPPKLLHR